VAHRDQLWVIWLDDLERFVGPREEGLNVDTLDVFQRWPHPPLIVTTAGGKGLQVASDTARHHSELQVELFSRPRGFLISLVDRGSEDGRPALSEREIGRLRKRWKLDGVTAGQVAEQGIGEYMLGRAAR